MTDLINTSQYEEIKLFLGFDPYIIGERRIAPIPKQKDFTYVINSKGTHLIRLAGYDKRNHYQKTHLMSTFINRGYIYSSNNYKMHRLVAEAFLPDWNPELTVNHKDGNKLHNDFENLEMMTIVENNRHYQEDDCFIEARKLQKEKVSRNNKGKHNVSDETRKKLSDAAKAYRKRMREGK